MSDPRIVVISTLFPSAAQPAAGLFIRERMFRVARRAPLVVISPQPWFPFQSLIRAFRRHYRPKTAPRETQSGIEVYFPRFLAIPGVLRRFDGFFCALACVRTMTRLKRTLRFNIIDAHFAYPSGFAAYLLGRWFDVPVTITIRGTEPSHLRRAPLRRRIVRALCGAARVIAVSESLRRLALEAGVPAERTQVVGNGVDAELFAPIGRHDARARLGIPAACKVIVSVGGLVERKGFHRVVDALPSLLARGHDVRYVVVGGPSPEGDMSGALREQVTRLALAERVLFTGAMPPRELIVPLSAADAFVLATRNEGWANVFLEAMAAGLPIVTTDVGGNREVVCRDELGILVPFGDSEALAAAIDAALRRNWDREAIIAHAKANTWDRRVDALMAEFSAIARDDPTALKATARA